MHELSCTGERSAKNELTVNTVNNSQTTKNVVELIDFYRNSYCYVTMDLQKGSCKGNARFNSLEIIWESKRSGRVHFLSFQRA